MTTNKTMRFKQGDIVNIKPEWQDKGDGDIEFVCVENEDGGRVRIEYKLGMSFNPQSVVTTEMICH